MPLRFRFSLGERFVITKGLGCLCVFSEDTAKELEDQLAGLGNTLTVLLDPHVSRLTRHFFSGMVEASCDNKQYRVQLTPEHRRYAGIIDEVVIRGCGLFLELWSPDGLAKYEAQNARPEDLIAAGAAVLPTAFASKPAHDDAGVPSAGPGQ